MLIIIPVQELWTLASLPTHGQFDKNFYKIKTPLGKYLFHTSECCWEKNNFSTCFLNFEH